MFAFRCQVTTASSFMLASMIAVVTQIPHTIGASLWTDPCNGSLIVEPGDTQVIRTARTVPCIEINAGGFLMIAGGASLEITGENASSTVNGELHIEGDGGLVVASDHRATGSGTIRGLGQTAYIDIKAGATFTSEVCIAGGLRVLRVLDGDGVATFANHATVHARSGNTIRLDETVEITDTASSLWRAGDRDNRSKGVLAFRRDASLLGDLELAFTGSKADFGLVVLPDVDVSVEQLSMVSGTTVGILSNGSSLAYDSFTSDCSDEPPENPITSTYTCSP